ncbi:MAG: hypothetical protein RMY30_026050 [Nostoc sp. CmiSLP01]|nr:hypothetical protein [Nostoc sp. CmiSLP01]MDZ8282161.1 hypothetical protein [Nostoc sp. ChiSLP01]
MTLLGGTLPEWHPQAYFSLVKLWKDSEAIACCDRSLEHRS